MLTIFTIPKPFEGHTSIIQRNAIQSWLQLRPKCEVILCGRDDGVATVSKGFGVQHIADVACTVYGTPLLSSAFKQVQDVAQHRLICYVNADIILFSDLLTAIERIPFKRFLMVGQRWDLDVKTEIDFESVDCANGLASECKSRGVLHPASGSDYFVFPKGSIGELPDFAVGRPGWDNWLIYRARALGLPLVDATEAVTIIHQNHDYGHVPKRRGDTYDGPEGDENLALVGGSEKKFILLDATWLLTPKELVPARTFKHLLRVMFLWIALHLRLYPLHRKIKRALAFLKRFPNALPG
ncbi:MAG: hypothetical protein WC647_18540 [Desulfomonilaceae bacterium]|jgi:hypothetical protein